MKRMGLMEIVNDIIEFSKNGNEKFSIDDIYNCGPTEKTIKYEEFDKYFQCLIDLDFLVKNEDGTFSIKDHSN